MNAQAKWYEWVDPQSSLLASKLYLTSFSKRVASAAARRILAHSYRVSIVTPMLLSLKKTWFVNNLAPSS